jgi:RNA polymerase sigma factor (sigma-70 family)
MPDSSAVLKELIDGCLQKDRRSQELIYKQFYGYAMGFCIRYTKDKEEAKEILNDGFLKIFTKLESYDRERSFSTWLARVMINTALDRYRKESRQQPTEDLQVAEQVAIDENVISQLAHDELITLIQRLPSAYRIVFNLFVIDGFTHEEIAEKIGISEGTSKSNLFRAREKLKLFLSQKKVDDYERVAR